MWGNKKIIHQLAEVNSKSIGNNTRIWQFVIIMEQAVIGDECNICCHCLIENEVIIGDRVTIKSGVQLWDGITLEDDVFIGPNATFTNHKFPRSKEFLKDYPKTVIRKGASIGANATILPGITIGEKALIGAGSVVNKNIPPCEIWIGNPAKFYKKIND